MECCLCNDEIQPQTYSNGKVWELGHNAQPLKDGRCCVWCNEDVIHTRIVSFDIGQIKAYNHCSAKKGVEKIPADELELKRQLLMNEGREPEYDDDGNEI